jgi:hypothetical protein
VEVASLAAVAAVDDSLQSSKIVKTEKNMYQTA